MKNLTIGFIGNFIPEHSTENERKWSFEKLGHTVIPYQENTTTAYQLMQDMQKLDMLMYSHTHDPAYVIEGLKEVFASYKEKGIPTVSAHLDRWVGLERVKDMGEEATWFTEFIFMADASPEAQEMYNKLGLKWYWLKPGVVAKDCYMAEPDYKKFPHAVVFTGSLGYHKEYPWRAEMIEFLKKTYLDNFAHYGNGGNRVIRGDELNTLYASAKVVVGDSCFAGDTSNYWSDRIPEVTGRGGFLVHPWVEGCDHRGVVFFRDRTLESMKIAIDYYLKMDKEREELREKGFEWTKNNRTYTHLAQEILDIVFP